MVPLLFISLLPHDNGQSPWRMVSAGELHNQKRDGDEIAGDFGVQ
jgi:hypothetical protein